MLKNSNKLANSRTKKNENTQKPYYLTSICLNSAKNQNKKSHASVPLMLYLLNNWPPGDASVLCPLGCSPIFMIKCQTGVSLWTQEWVSPSFLASLQLLDVAPLSLVLPASSSHSGRKTQWQAFSEDLCTRCRLSPYHEGGEYLFLDTASRLVDTSSYKNITAFSCVFSLAADCFAPPMSLPQKPASLPHPQTSIPSAASISSSVTCLITLVTLPLRPSCRPAWDSSRNPPRSLMCWTMF
jgi:hypothetical protein